jgi:hypothetical protein
MKQTVKRLKPRHTVFQWHSKLKLKPPIFQFNDEKLIGYDPKPGPHFLDFRNVKGTIFSDITIGFKTLPLRDPHKP